MEIAARRRARRYAGGGERDARRRAHCYALYAGEQAIAEIMKDELGTFFVTDFLVRHFDRLVIHGLGLDRFPHLRDDYFRGYKRIVYLAQTKIRA